MNMMNMMNMMNQNNMNNMNMVNQNNMNNSGIMNEMINSMNQMNNMVMTMIYQNLKNNTVNNNNFNNQVNQTNDNNNNENCSDLDDKLTILFKRNKKNVVDFEIRIICKDDELVGDIIDRYCFKTNENKKDLLFLYNSKKLDESQTVQSAQLNSTSIIYVVDFGNTFGAKLLFS